MSEHSEDLCHYPHEEGYPVIDPYKDIEFEGVGDIFVSDVALSDGKRKVTISKVDYLPPVINITATPIKEVGSTNSFTWEGNIIKGRDEITARSLTPQTDPATDLTAPFSIAATGVTQNTLGFKKLHTLSVTDARNTVVAKDLGIAFAGKIYQGFSAKDNLTELLTEADIEAFTGTLAASVLSVYGGEKSYTIPTSAINLYPYWIFPDGTQNIVNATLNGFKFPMVDAGRINITNTSGITLSYVIMRAANKFGSGTFKLVLS